MRPIAEYEPMERERFEREIVPKGEPAVFRGLAADWAPVKAAKDGLEPLAAMLRLCAADEPPRVLGALRCRRPAPDGGKGRRRPPRRIAPLLRDDRAVPGLVRAA